MDVIKDLIYTGPESIQEQQSASNFFPKLTH